MTFVALTEIAEIQSGIGFPTKYQGLSEGEYPFAKVGDISQAKRKGGHTISTANNYISAEVCRKLKAKPFPENTIVFAKIGEAIRNGNKVITSRPMIFDNNVMGITPDPSRVYPPYLYRYLDNVDFYDLANSTTVPSIRKTDMAALAIWLPPIDEQRRVAAILDRADEVRHTRRRAIDRLNQLGQATFHEMFGEWDQPGFNTPTLQLGNYLDFLTSGSRGWAEYYRDSGDLFLRIQNVKRDELDLSDVAYIEAPDSAEAKRTRVQPGDVLLSITADLGRTAVIPDDIGDAYINQHLAIIRTKSFNPRFLSAALSSPAGQRAILKRNREGVKAGLNFDDVRSVCLPDASRDHQDVFAKRVQCLDELKNAQKAAKHAADKLFASLQHRAFRGEL